MHDDFYQMYLEEVKEIPACTREEQEELLRAAKLGEEAAKKRLIEGCLRVALDCAGEFDGQGVLLTDLVQESNMALILAVQEAIDCGLETGFNRFARERLCSALTSAVEEQKRSEETKEELTARANVLETVAQALAQELGREATLSELAEKMKMSEYQVREIMRMALDAMSLNTEGLEEMAEASERGVAMIEALTASEEGMGQKG